MNKPTPPQNRPSLISLMNKHGVSISIVAKLLGKRPATIRVYRCSTGSDIPSSELERLQYKLAEKFPLTNK